MATPVSVYDALDHLRLGSDASGPELLEIQRMIEAATEWTEAFCKRAWMSGTKVATFTDFPSGVGIYKRALVLGGGVADSITSLTYYDGDFAQQTVASSLYRLVTPHGRSLLYPAMGEAWPSDASCEPENIAVTYVIGEILAEDVPSSVKQAILLIVGSLYEFREQGIVEPGGTMVQAPVGAEALLYPYRLSN